MFRKDKDVVHKIANSIFIIWFTTVSLMTLYIFVNVIIPDKEITYEAYSNEQCRDSYTLNCDKRYELELLSQKRNKRAKKKNLLDATINLAIISGTLYFLNKEGKEKDN